MIRKGKNNLDTAYQFVRATIDNRQLFASEGATLIGINQWRFFTPSVISVDDI